MRLLADPSIRYLSGSCSHSISYHTSQHLLSRPHSSDCGHIYGSPCILPPDGCSGNGFLKVFKLCEVKEAQNNLSKQSSAFQLGADRSSFGTQSCSAPGQEPQRCCRSWLCSAQAQAAFPTAAEITLNFTSYPRSYQANYPGRKPRAVPKAKVLCQACPGDTSKDILYLATTNSIFCHSEESHKAPAMV